MKPILLGNQLPKPQLMIVNGFPLPPFSTDEWKLFGKKRKYVCGADDPEMEEIIFYLTQHGCNFVEATYNGKRVSPETANYCDPVECEDGETLTFVECRPRKLDECGPVEEETKEGEKKKTYFVDIVDHHPVENLKEGDLPQGSGCNLPPLDYLHGSSLGQVSFLEGYPLTVYQMALAAIDHCPAQAIAGLCPGVDPDYAKTVYLEVTMRKKKVALPDIHNCLSVIGKVIAKAPSANVGKIPVVDTSGTPTGNGYSLPYICSIYAAAELRLPLLVSNRNEEKGPEKRVLTGFVTPELVHSFRKDYAVQHKLRGLWGDNNRGAGGFLP